MITPEMKVTKTFDDRAILDRTIKALQDHFARVGFLTGAGTHPDSDLPTATIAVYNEFGTPTARHPSPARPFMRPVFSDRALQIAKIKELLPGNVFEKSGERLKKAPNVKRFYTLYGMSMVSKVQEKIRSNVPPPNAEWTIAQKGSTKTLIDTGAMIQAVSHEVV